LVCFLKPTSFNFILEFKNEGDEKLELYRDEQGIFKVTTTRRDRKRKIVYQGSSSDEDTRELSSEEQPVTSEYTDYVSADEDELW